MNKVGEFGREQPYWDYFPTAANMKTKQLHSSWEMWKTAILDLRCISQRTHVNLNTRERVCVCGDTVKSAAHASVPLINLPLQGSWGIYILLMLRIASDAHIFNAHAHTGTCMYRGTAHLAHANISYSRKQKIWGCSHSLCEGYCSHQVQSVLLRGWAWE